MDLYIYASLAKDRGRGNAASMLVVGHQSGTS